MLKQCQNSSINKVCKGMLEFLTVQESCCYDAIVCTWALMCEQPQKVLNQCQRLLKNGGYLYILVNDHKHCHKFEKFIQNY
ncbi:MAG: methyltransferase domain-containing protein [Thomasclavelia ramosa]